MAAAAKTKRVRISETSLERLRDAGQMDAGVLYVISASRVAVSPDGQGCYWYDSIAAAAAEHELN